MELREEDVEGGCHLLTRNIDDVTVGDRFLRDGGLGEDACLHDHFGCFCGVVVGKFDGFFVFTEEERKLDGVRLCPLGTDDDTALGKGTLAVDLFPLGGEVEGGLEGCVGVLGDGHHRLGEDGDIHLTRGDGGAEVCGLREGGVDGDVLAGLEIIGAADRLEDERGVLGGAIDGLALEVGKAVDLDLVVGQEIEHAEGVDRGDLHLSAGLIIDGRGGVGGERGDVNRAVDKACGYVCGVALNGEVVVEDGEAARCLVDHLRGAKACGAVEDGDADLGLAVVGDGFKLGFLVCLGGSGGGLLDDA